GDYLLQRLQQDVAGTLQMRLFRCLRNAIIDSVLAPKTRLPASRDLAKEIQVSRNTVLNAYEQLQAQGYVDARNGQGTWVVENYPNPLLLMHNTLPALLRNNKRSQITFCRNAVPACLAILRPRLINGEPLYRVHPM